MQEKIQVTQPYKRLDTYLSHHLKIPKNQALQLIKNSQISLNHAICNKGGKELKTGDLIKITFLENQKKDHTKKSIDFDIEILYEDEDILLLNKPSNLIIHSAPSHQEITLVDWLQSKNFSLSNLSGKERYGIIHRLDKDTTGAILVAKNNTSHQHLSLQLKNRSMGRYYLALISPVLKETMDIECYLGRNPKNRLKISKLDPKKFPSARYSKSIFTPLLTNENKKIQLIMAQLFTGRTHQIRAHLESVSRHIIGDKTYGYEGDFKGRLQLHAFFIYFIHPKSQKKMLFKAPIFNDMLECLQYFFSQDSIDAVLQSSSPLFCAS